MCLNKNVVFNTSGGATSETGSSQLKDADEAGDQLDVALKKCFQTTNVMQTELLGYIWSVVFSF